MIITYTWRIYFIAGVPFYSISTGELLLGIQYSQSDYDTAPDRSVKVSGRVRKMGIVTCQFGHSTSICTTGEDLARKKITTSTTNCDRLSAVTVRIQSIGCELWHGFDLNLHRRHLIHISWQHKWKQQYYYSWIYFIYSLKIDRSCR